MTRYTWLGPATSLEFFRDGKPVFTQFVWAGDSVELAGPEGLVPSIDNLIARNLLVLQTAKAAEAKPAEPKQPEPKAAEMKPAEQKTKGETK